MTALIGPSGRVVAWVESRAEALDLARRLEAHGFTVAPIGREYAYCPTCGREEVQT